MNPESDQSFIDEINGRSNMQKPDVYAKFYWQSVPNKAKSQTEGRPIFDQKPYILLVPKGQRGEERRLPASDQFRQMFPKEWEAFEQGAEAPASGTPIGELPGLSVSMIAELQALSIRTIEDLAAISDLAVQQLGIGGNSLRQRAQAFLEKNSPQIAELTRALAAMMERISALEDENAALKAKPKRGRPAKKAV